LSQGGAQAIILRNGRILLGKRSREGWYKGLWCTFGGRIEQGETPAEAVMRELYEELGIKIANPELIDSVEDEFKHQIHFFLVRRWEGELTNKSEHSEIRWFSKDDLRDLPIVWIARNIIEKHLKNCL